MSYDACEKLVKTGDPDRYLSAQSAPPEGRKALMAIYAVNLEIARAPWASPEPLVAQMRLRWWADEIDRIYKGVAVTTHEILPALRDVIFDHDLPHHHFEALIEARMNDVYADPPESRAMFDAYIEATSGSVMALAARALGTPEAAMPVVTDFAYGTGVANLLRAVPALKARGRRPFPEPAHQIVKSATNQMAHARKHRMAIPASATAAMLAGWRADATLSHALKHPEHIDSGLLEESPARKMMTLRWRSITKKW
ncbi:MAG: phytoene synthase [Rhodobacteraceae bacterium]|nr:phytoene synthase [Paracoccaceae bacterium]